MGKYKTLGTNTILVFIGNASAKLIGLLMLPLYTRWLSVEDYGLTDLLTVYVTFLVGIVSCSIYEAIFVYPKNKTPEEQTSYYTSAYLFAFSSFGLWAFILWLVKVIGCDFLGVHNSLTENVWYVYIMLVSQILLNIAQQFTRSINKMLIYSLTGAVVTAFTAIYAFLLIPKYAVSGYIWSITLAQITGAVFAFIASKSYSFINVSHISVLYLREMLTYSIPLIPNAIMWWLVNAINRPLLEHSVGMNGIGLYAVANKFPGVLTMLFLVFINSWQISVLDEYGKEGFEKFYNKVLKIVAFGLTFGVILITIFSDVIVRVFTTEDYINAWYLIPILTLGVMFSNLGGYAGVIYSAVRKSKYYFYTSVWSAVAAVFLNSILIPLFGLYGAAVSTMVSFLVLAVSRFLYSQKFVKIERPFQYVILVFITICFYAVKLLYVDILISLLLLLVVCMLYFYTYRSSILELYSKVTSRFIKSR